MWSTKRIAIGVAVLAAFFAAYAGDTCSDTSSMKMMKPTHEFRYLSPGSAWLSLGKVNGFLVDQGLSRFPEQAWTITAGGYRDFGRFVMEHTLSIRIWGDNLNGSLRSSLCVGDITWNTGFNALPPEWMVSLYPYLGLGIGMNSMYFRANSRTLSGASGVLASTEPNSYTWEVTPLLNLGLGTNWLFANPDKTMGFVLGLRGGYLVDLYYTKRWLSYGVYVSDLPSISETGGYVRLVLGAWGNHKHHHHDM
jgi:hypothetical protein